MWLKKDFLEVVLDLQEDCVESAESPYIPSYPPPASPIINILSVWCICYNSWGSIDTLLLTKVRSLHWDSLLVFYTLWVWTNA